MSTGMRGSTRPISCAWWRSRARWNGSFLRWGGGGGGGWGWGGGGGNTAAGQRGIRAGRKQEGAHQAEASSQGHAGVKGAAAAGRLGERGQAAAGGTTTHTSRCGSRGRRPHTIPHTHTYSPAHTHPHTHPHTHTHTPERVAHGADVSARGTLPGAPPALVGLRAQVRVHHVKVGLPGGGREGVGGVRGGVGREAGRR